MRMQSGSLTARWPMSPVSEPFMRPPFSARPGATLQKGVSPIPIDRIHKTLRVTPAIAAGLADKLMSKEIVIAATSERGTRSRAA